MAKLTITEALAELNTISKRLEKKKAHILTYLTQPEALKDPLAKDGGSAQAIERERQSIRDLENRHVNIRLAIQKANHETQVTVNNVTKSLADWLTWRKEIAPNTQLFLQNVRQAIDRARQVAARNGVQIVKADVQDAKPQDIRVNIDEALLARETEELETTLGSLDGQLSLKNATVTIDVS